jgi:hypothetical protein
MSIVVSTNRLEPAQHTAAKVAGFLYLLTMVTANFAEFYARGRLIVAGDTAQTAKNIAASERLFRLGIVSNLITFASVVILLLALYVVLKPINRNVALLATFWRLAECSIFALITLNDFVTLRLLSGDDYLRAFDTQQLRRSRTRSSACTTRDISSDWCFSVWGRPCSPTCGSSRATPLDGWPRWASSRRCWWQSSLWPSWCSPAWQPS